MKSPIGDIPYRQGAIISYCILLGIFFAGGWLQRGDNRTISDSSFRDIDYSNPALFSSSELLWRARFLASLGRPLRSKALLAPGWLLVR